MTRLDKFKLNFKKSFRILFFVFFVAFLVFVLFNSITDRTAEQVFSFAFLHRLLLTPLAALALAATTALQYSFLMLLIGYFRSPKALK